MTNDISIEYAHIYTNQHIDDEHQLSTKILSDLKSKFDAENKRISLVVMVDDYSFPDPSFNYISFSGWLDQQGFKPDILFRESQLIPVCDEVLKLVDDNKLKMQIEDYIKSKKYPCSLFIAAWYLIRLGKLKSPQFASELTANKLLNILPESFRPFEDKGLEIISSTPFKDCIGDIEYNFISGRLIA